MSTTNGLRTKHHILPKSRIPDLAKVGENQVLVDADLHTLFHQLFGNRTPPEVIDFLNQAFWGNSFTILVIPKNNIKEMLMSLNGNKPPMPRRGAKINQTFLAAYQICLRQKEVQEQ
jgi:hypothetical protein